MKLSKASLRIIFDSRGEKTLSAEFESGNFNVSADVPAGKSLGAHEVFVQEPEKALVKFQSIKNQVLSSDFENQKDFDNFLISLDGTAKKDNLGGNLILALSLAWARLKAKNEEKELWQYIAEIFSQNKNYKFPKPIFNVINGGAHVNPELAEGHKNKLDIQEFQIIPETDDFEKGFSCGQEFYRKLREVLENKFGPENIILGDEAGFSCQFGSNEEALSVLADLIAKENFPLRIGLDMAANHYFKNNSYVFDSKNYSASEMTDIYLNLAEKYKIISIEDPFPEESFSDFAYLKAKIKEKYRKDIFLVADDLTTTNPQRLKTAIENDCASAIIIKPNQIGTLSETLRVAQLADEAHWKTIVSHRSAETTDDFIADLAVGIGAWGIKAGAPAKPERLAKYNRLLEIFRNK